MEMLLLEMFVYLMLRIDESFPGFPL